ncbi:MAG: beta-N-acetylhexosaminidase [Clostridia bacterium]|nr:beta-N-acetylhexosaminidase [Clostridia bacterium]
MKYSIIPKPVKYEVKDDSVEISENTEIRCFKEFEFAGNFLSQYLKTAENASDGIIMISKAKSIAEEGYALYTENGTIQIKASTEAGAFYAAVTLKWILMQVKKIDGKKTVSGFLIEDKPQYPHRGIMLDEARHFFGADVVKSLLDNMAMLKLNVFHWHLADDQGYRIESKAFPKLNEIGSKRKFADLQGLGQKNGGGEYGPYYYTHREIRDIVEYAKKRNITVIPELDVPGHCSAMAAAYPELLCPGRTTEVVCKNGIMKSIMCAGSEDTFAFLDKLYDEICPLFDGKYFHIGGDEALYDYWNNCPKCKERMKDNSISSGKQLQLYFMNRVNEMLKKRGKLCIAWNDCLSDELDNDIACQYWIGKNKQTVKKQSEKRDIILSPMLSFYFDMKHATVPTEKVYRFSEKRSGFKNARIRGVEAELWTEWIDGGDVVEYSFYPRIAAVAEVGWTSEKKRRYSDFSKRLEFYELYLKSMGINYYKHKPSLLLSRFQSWYSFGRNGKEFKNN